jgi:hypothetical protein
MARDERGAERERDDREKAPPFDLSFSSSLSVAHTILFNTHLSLFPLYINTRGLRLPDRVVEDGEGEGERRDALDGATPPSFSSLLSLSPHTSLSLSLATLSFGLCRFSLSVSVSVSALSLSLSDPRP